MAPTVAEQPAPAAKKADLKIRVMSGAVYGALFIGALWAGGWVLAGFLAVLWLLAVWEWARLTGGARPVGSAALILLTPVAYIAAFGLGGLPILLLLIVPFSLLLLGKSYRWCLWTLLGMVYFGFSAAAMLIVFLAGDALSVGSLATTFFLAWLVAVVWATDVGAYFFGRAIGGLKLAPRISPGKTWSGAVGGACAAVVAGSVFVAIVAPLSVVWALAPVALWASVWGQVGDLFESWVKRRFGAKDSGTLIPGHGGVLDRIDGLLFASMATAPLFLFGSFAIAMFGN